MKKHELIKHAYDNYQKGTICTWYNNKKDFHYTEFQSSGEFEFDDEGDIFINYPDDQTVEYVYCDGQWAKIVAQYPPKKEFIMMSEDGISLCVGDKMYGAHYKSALKKWVYTDFHGEPFVFNENTLHIQQDEDFPYISSPQTHKAFSTKEAAEKWIEEANKPKSITIGENSQYPVIVTATEATIKCIGDVHKDNIILWPGEINEIADAIEQLNRQS